MRPSLRLGWVVVIAVSLMIMLLMILPVTATQLALFQDDFAGGANNWTVQAGTWAVVVDGTNQVYSATNSGANNARSYITETTAPGSMSWTDYSVQARVKVLAGTYFGMLMARYQDSRNYYFMTLRTNGNVEVRRFVNNSSTTLGTASGVITTGTWYTATFEVKGFALRALIDGNPVLTVTDPISAYSSGPVALGLDRSTVQFDDVIVTDLRTFNLTVSSIGSGSGSISSEPAGIDCGATCQVSFDANNVITLTATADAGSTFAGWQGAGCVGTGQCVVTMNAAKSVTAVFASTAQPMLVVYKNGTGSGSIGSVPGGIDCGATCAAGFAQNTIVTLTATPAGDSAFTGWAGACTGGGACVVTMDVAKNVTATFTLQIFNLTVTRSGNGSGAVTSVPAGINCGSTCTASFIQSTVVTLTAVPDTGSTFAGWTGEGCSGTGACVVTLTAAANVEAAFTLIPYALTVDRAGSGGGTIASNPAGINICGTLTCTANFNYGTVVTLTAAPDANSVFAGWHGEGCSGVGGCTVTINADKTVTATFSLITYTLSVTKTGAGSGVIASNPAGIDCGATCEGVFDSGSVVTLTATPDAGSVFAGWLGTDCVGMGACVVTVDAAQSVTAVFALTSQPALVVYRGGDGTGLITSQPAGINCGATCTAPYIAGQVVTLTATPVGESAFAGWTGACSGAGACVVTMNTAQNVMATFFNTSNVLFYEDFESGAGRWSVVDGTWAVVAGDTQVYSQTASIGFARSAAGSNSWTDYAIRANVVVNGKYAKLITRYQDANNYYFAALRADNHKIEFKRMTATGSAGLGGTPSSTPFITTGLKYTATFEVVGNRLRVFLDDTPVFTSTDNGGNPLTWGKIGLGTLDSAATFDNIVVTSLATQYTLTVGTLGTGGGTVTDSSGDINCGLACLGLFNSGAVVTLTATPQAGSTFVGWVGVECVGQGPVCAVTMNAAKSISAVFSTAAQPVLLVNKLGTGYGTVTSVPSGIDCGNACLASFSPGTIVTLTATASTFSEFTGWSGACNGTGTCVVTVDNAKSVSATFTYLTYPLTVTKAGRGAGVVTSTPSGLNCGLTCTIQAGGLITLTAAPSAGSSFGGWSGACSGIGVCALSMTSARAVTATFNRYDLYLPLIRNFIMTVTVPSLYVAPTGSDTNPGTLTLPLKSLHRAVALAVPGQTIYLRGGNYSYTSTVVLATNGNNVNMLKIWAYPGERPVLDFAGSSFGSRGFLITGNSWHLKGLEIKNAPDNAIKIEGSYNIIEQCVLHDNQDTGLQIGLETSSTNPLGNLAAYNQVINCDSYRNFDAATNGSNADGFAIKLHPGKGNIITGSRAWENADDGWDLFLTDYPVVIENSWTWHNGDRALFGNPATWGGNGNGFKVGGGPNNAAHILRNCIAFDHKYGSGSTTKGFDQNHNLTGVTIYNSLAWDNTTNFAFSELPNDGSQHTLKNNISFSGTVSLAAGSIQISNTWNLTATVTADVNDFMSLAESVARGPRLANGSLPDVFARLVETSDLIDKGVDVGLPFLGLAPDLGPFERR